MEINNKAGALGIIGIFIILASTIRWYFIYYDLSQAITGIVLGGIILFVAWIYNWVKQAEVKMDEREIKLGGFAKHFMEKEFR